MNTITIGSLTFQQFGKPLVIAEAGINHNGDVTIAKQMVHTAKKTGADIIKFQTHIAEAEMLPDRSIGSDAGSHVTRSLFDIMKECELSLEDHIMLQKEAEKEGILFLSTPFSIEAVELLEKIYIPAFKIGSGEVSNLPFLEYIAKKGKPMIVSTGTATWNEVEKVVGLVKGMGIDLILMQCTSNYPTAYKDVHIGAMCKMHEDFNVPVGLSDHCTGNYACFGAVARGACVVEKHFTLSRKLPGVDQSSSIEPHELKDLVDGVKGIYEACGNTKELNAEAKKVRLGFSESIVTIREVKKGETLIANENIWVKRPGSGIPSYELDTVVGKKAVNDLAADYLLERTDYK